MGNACVQSIFEKYSCKMLGGVMVLMRGFWIGTLHKLLVRIDTNGCVNTVFPKYDNIYSCLVSLTMLWHQWMGHTSEKGLHSMHGKGMVKFSPIVL